MLKLLNVRANSCSAVSYLVLKKTVSQQELPADKPKLLIGVGAPDEVLEVLPYVDIVVSTFVTLFFF